MQATAAVAAAAAVERGAPWVVAGNAASAGQPQAQLGSKESQGGMNGRRWGGPCILNEGPAAARCSAAPHAPIATQSPKPGPTDRLRATYGVE